MTDSTWWWLLGGVLVALELVTGTFLLLMLASGAAAGALAAHLGLALPAQITAAAVMGAAAVLVWFRVYKRAEKNLEQPQLGAQATGHANLDIGQTVTVSAWLADSTAQVHYRGAPWTARLRASSAQEAPTPGIHRICDVQGNVLIVERLP